MKRILVVDDDPNLLDSLLRHFRPLRDEWEVETALDGREALHRAREHPFDVVVTDILMPERDGLETITALRRAQPDTRIVAMSGGGRHVSVGTLRFARMLGADDTLEKPFEPRALIDTVRSLLQRRGDAPGSAARR